MLGIVDYGAGNLKSALNAVAELGIESRICAVPSDLRDAQRLILPGVGHFASAAKNMRRSGVMEAVWEHIRREKPALGICLGMQLLASASDEGSSAGNAPDGQEADEELTGLCVIQATVRRLRAERVPHMGWNTVDSSRASDLLGAIDSGPYYFAHSFAVEGVEKESFCTLTKAVVATADAGGDRFPAIVESGSAIGVQFHPEKSGDRGMRLLERFCRC